MKMKEFDYRKKNGELGHYKIYVLEEREDRIFGFTSKDLTENARKLLEDKESFSNEELKALECRSNIRCFLKNNIID